jgi:aspartate/methionine/tyrosine aminotransferase
VPGGKVTIFFACMMFGGAQSEILYSDPGFLPYREVVRAAGINRFPTPFASEDFGFDAEEVLPITPATRLIIVNSPANPTGGVVARGGA